MRLVPAALTSWGVTAAGILWSISGVIVVLLVSIAVTTAAAADVGGAAAGTKEAFDERMQIDRRRLLVPVLGESRGAGVIGAERCPVHAPPHRRIAVRNDLDHV